MLLKYIVICAETQSQERKSDLVKTNTFKNKSTGQT